MVTLAHLLNTSIYVYSPNFGDDGVDRNGRWIRHSPHSVNTTLPDVPSQMAMYLYHTPGHFEVLLNILTNEHSNVY